MKVSSGSFLLPVSSCSCSWMPLLFLVLSMSFHPFPVSSTPRRPRTPPPGVNLLSQSHFTRGTVRLVVPGEYWLTEDITFDPNRGVRNAAGGWFPSPGQLGFEYPALPFSVGFFSAITIEGANITLDLNGYVLEYSRSFQIQQAFGSLIHLASTPFDPNAFGPKEGPGPFGDTIQSAMNCVIRNGELGRVAHHGIQGNNVVGCVMEDLIISQYRVAGIHLNNARDVTIQRVHLQGSVQDLPIVGRYSNGRFMLQLLREFPIRERRRRTITFHDRRVLSLQQILRRLEYTMDLLFRNFIEGDDRVFFDPFYTGEFFNFDGVPDGGSLYGIIINGFGVALFGLGGSPPTSSNVVIQDVVVENMVLRPREHVISVWNECTASGATGNILPFVERFASNGLENISQATYVGSALGDAQFALSKHTNVSATDRRRVLLVPPRMALWAETGTSLNASDFVLHCNSDSQGHVDKGIFGVRIDGTNGFELRNVTVKKLKNEGDLGTRLCGEYTLGGGAHPRQLFPGYTANTVRGISIVNSTGVVRGSEVTELESTNGVVIGIDVTHSSVRFGLENKVSYLFPARTDIPHDLAPNPVPSGCGVFYADSDAEVFGRPDAVKTMCVGGVNHCGVSPSLSGVTMFGQEVPCPLAV